MSTHLKCTTRIVLSVCAVFFLGSVAGCAKEEPNDAAAIVDGVAISMAELDEAVAAFQQQFAAQGQPVPPEQLSAFKAEVLANMIRKMIMLNEAESAGVAVSEETVDSEYGNVRAQFPSEEQFAEALAAQGYTPESLRRQIGEDLSVSALIDEMVLTKIEIPESDVSAFFNENRQYFELTDSVTASHILVKLDENATDDEKKAARDKIEDILTDLKGGADFATLAKERSEGPSGPNGGDLGTFGRGQMVPPFEEAAFALEPGELSGIVISQFGYHVILVRERVEGRSQTVDEVREEIVDYLRQSQGQEQVSAYIEGLVEQATVENFVDTGE